MVRIKTASCSHPRTYRSHHHDARYDLPPWLAWLFLHLVYLVGFRARLTTTVSWIGTFIGSQRGQLTITGQQAYARTRIEQLEEIVAEVEDDDEIDEAAMAGNLRAKDSTTVAS